MQTKILEKQQAIAFRRQGLTYLEILKRIPVAKSTLSLWLRSAELSKPQKQRITYLRMRAQKRASLARKIKREETQQEIYSEAESEVDSISLKNLWFTGVALYWAEGSKEKSYRPGQGVSFSNSDPDMIFIFIKWIQLCVGVSLDRIRCDIYIHENHKVRTEEVRRFWSLKTGFPIEHFSRVYFKKNVPAKVYRKNRTALYNGLLRVNISASSNLNRRITGWIRGIVKYWGVV